MRVSATRSSDWSYPTLTWPLRSPECFAYFWFTLTFSPLILIKIWRFSCFSRTIVPLFPDIRMFLRKSLIPGYFFRKKSCMVDYFRVLGRIFFGHFGHMPNMSSDVIWCRFLSFVSFVSSEVIMVKKSCRLTTFELSFDNLSLCRLTKISCHLTILTVIWGFKLYLSGLNALLRLRAWC